MLGYLHSLQTHWAACCPEKVCYQDSMIETLILLLTPQVTDRAAAALTLKADGEEVSELKLSMKGQLAELRAAAKEGWGRGRLTHTTAAGQTLCLSCDQPLAPIRGHMHEPLAPQGRG